MKHTILGENALRILDAQKGLESRATYHEEAARKLNCDARLLNASLRDELNAQYAHLIGKPVIMRFDWKMTEHPDIENEWRGQFLGFFYMGGYCIYPKVMKNKRYIWTIRGQYHHIANIKSIEPYET